MENIELEENKRKKAYKQMTIITIERKRKGEREAFQYMPQDVQM